MVQINDDYYEDLDGPSMTALLEAIARGERPRPGPQNGRQTSAAVTGPTSLAAFTGVAGHETAPAGGAGPAPEQG
jgi:NADH-quinone oxidoreductase subunit E